MLHRLSASDIVADVAAFEFILPRMERFVNMFFVFFKIFCGRRAAAARATRKKLL
jgi:hypothetical protein